MPMDVSSLSVSQEVIVTLSSLASMHVSAKGIKLQEWSIPVRVILSASGGQLNFRLQVNVTVEMLL